MMRVGLKYSLEHVDPYAIYEAAPVPTDFLRRFEYTLYGGPLLDVLPIVNGVSWLIFSPRITAVIRSACTGNDVELLPLPVEVDGKSRVLDGYHVLSVKVTVNCLDLDKSVYRGDRERIGALYECVIMEERVPADVNCFFIKEYPGFVVFRSKLVQSIMALQPSGFDFEDIEQHEST